MLCIKKQIGTIFAIASPAILCISGFWNYTHLIDNHFVMTGSWLACMIGFIAILMVTGAQRRSDLPAHYVLFSALAVTFVAVFAAVSLRDTLGAATGESALLTAVWRTAAVTAMTGMVVSLFAVTQIAWRYASVNHPDSLAACSGLFKFVSLR